MTTSRYQRACELALQGHCDEATHLFRELTASEDAGVRVRARNALSVLAALAEQDDRASSRFRDALGGDASHAAALQNLEACRLSGRTEPDRPIRVVILSFLFNWPSTGGGIIHTVELTKFLTKAGYDVRLIHPQFTPWRIGQVDDTCSVPVTSVPFAADEWHAAAIKRRLRETIDVFGPDHVIITDSWNFKPHLAEAVEGYSYFLRMQAQECVCPLNNLRLVPTRQGLQQCENSQLADPDACHRCLALHDATSGGLHRAERALSGVGTPEYVSLLHRALRGATAVLVLNRRARPLYEEFADRVEVVTWGMDPERFPWPWPDEPPLPGCEGLTTLLFAGVVDEPIKGFDVLRTACRALWHKHQDFRLVVTADRPEQPEEFEQYVGWQDQASLPRYFRATDITVVPTIAQDGLSRTSVEAFAAGRPVIGSRIGGVPETVIDGETGLLFEPGNPQDLAVQIERLLDNAPLRRRLGDAGRRRFDERYRWEQVIERQYRPLLVRTAQAPRDAAQANGDSTRASSTDALPIVVTGQVSPTEFPPMNFVSHADLVADIKAWSEQLPRDLVAVAGVPRSGILAATLLALHRNLHLVTIDELERGERPWQQPLRRRVPARPQGTVLVLDDTMHTGETLSEVRVRLSGRSDVRFGAVYFTLPLPGIAEFGYRQILHPRCFEWNVFHSDYIEQACVDFDGVLCEDWTGFEADSGPDQQRYLRHLTEARPRWLPSYDVMSIVTSRLEKYRPQTLAWLGRHGVRFGELVMSPHASAESRRRAADHGRWKAECYRQRTQARLFVESDAGQACEIARLSRRPVLCTDTMTLCHA